MGDQMTSKATSGRVRKSSAEEVNKDIDEQITLAIKKYGKLSDAHLSQRLRELNREWDIEKALEVNASSLGLTGVLLGIFVDKRWFVLPGIVTAFLLQHGLQGWCPPLPLLRRLGFRTRTEIDEERYALKLLRGDYDKISKTSSAQQILEALRS